MLKSTEGLSQELKPKQLIWGVPLILLHVDNIWIELAKMLSTHIEFKVLSIYKLNEDILSVKGCYRFIGDITQRWVMGKTWSSVSRVEHVGQVLVSSDKT